MGKDLLRIEANERVDKGDFEYLADGAIQAEHRQVVGEFLTAPTRNRGWILDGFAIDCPAGKQVRVTLGRAILGQRIGGEIKYGVLSSEGDATKIVDINAYAAGNYGIYVRFGLVSGDSQSRIFWNPSGAGSEYAQTIATRYQANWTLRVESSSPGAEWLQIGTVAQATLAASAYPDTGITDQRAFYFEGSINSLEVAADFTWNNTTTVASGDTTGVAVGDFIGLKSDGQLFEIIAETPNVDVTIDNTSGLTIPAGGGAKATFVDTSSPAPYASGWSADGGSGGTTADDRKNSRQTYGVTDVQMFNATMRQCLEDIKGRGLRRWWERDIGGMNIGFDAAPSEDVLAIGDANFSLDYTPGATPPGTATPRIYYDANDYSQYNRSLNEYRWAVNNIAAAYLGDPGLTVTKGLRVGLLGSAVDDTIQVFDEDFGLYGAAVPSLKFHAGDGDEFRYNRAANRFEWLIGGTDELLLDSTGATLTGALTFGQGSAPQNLITSLAFPLNGVTVLAKNTSGVLLTQGMLVKLEDTVNAYLCIAATANQTDRVIGTVYDAAGIANGASGKITIWGPGHLRITNFAAGTAGFRIGPDIVAGLGAVAGAYYVGWIPYTQAGGAGERLIAGFIEGCQFI